MKNYLLVHGAWGEGSEFDQTLKLLATSDTRAVALDLPGHGYNFKPVSKVSLDRYVSRVAEAVTDIEDKVILVGHSFAGIVISRVAEMMPEKIDRLIYVCALLPRDGESGLGLMQSDSKQGKIQNLQRLSAGKWSECLR